MYRLKDKYLVSYDNKPVGDTPEHMVTSNSFLRKPLSVGGIGGIILLTAIAMGLLYVHVREIFDLTWLLLASLAVILYIIFSDKSLSKIETQRIIAIFVVSFFVVFFWSAYEQAGASLSFFAAEQTNLHIDLFNYDVPPSWFQ
jgi:POT family proton-dependent oligopeptide transporter